jgi:hypothetical protein
MTHRPPTTDQLRSVLRRPEGASRPAAPALIAAAFVIGTLLGGCTQSVGVKAPPAGDGASQSGEASEGFARFPDMPLPLKSSLDLDRTMVFGASEAWIGRLALTASFDPGQMFEFYRQQMPQFGWQEITTLRSAVSVLTYSRDGRVATIQIQKRTLTGSEVTITVSPQGGGASTFSGGASTSFGSGAAPAGSSRISVQPLAPPGGR